MSKRTQVQPRQWLFLLIIVSLGIVSNYFYQPLFSPLFHSDHAIWVMMTRELHWPDSLYFWGQNRLGSMIPLAAHVIHLLGMDALSALSLTQFLVQLICLLLIFRLTGSYWSVLFLAVLLFFPLWPFVAVIYPGHPYLSQILLFMLLIVLIDKVEHNKPVLLFVSITGVLMLWISELSAVLLFSSLLFYRNLWKKLNIRKVLPALSVLVLGILLMLIARNNMSKSPGYNVLFASSSDAISNFKALVDFTINYYYSSGPILFLSFLAIVGIAIYGVLTHYSKIVGILLLSSIASLVVTILSNWVSLNQSGSRYFSLPVYLFLMAFSIVVPKLKLSLRIISLVSALFLGWNSIDHIEYNMRPVSSRPTRAEIEQIADNMGEYNVYGDYWSVYLYAGLKPGIKVTTNLFYYARNRWDREEVVNSDTLLMLNYGFSDTVIIDDGRARFFPLGKGNMAGETYYQLYKKIPEND